MKLLNWLACLCLLTAMGCGKDIGDSCRSVNECITTDVDRLCLTEDGEGFPGGYCTKFNCGGQNACPEEAVCVAYRYTLGGGGCDTDRTISRLQRNYCMLRCDNDGDCRSGYKCLPADGDNPLGATIIDSNVGAKVCALEYYQPAKPPKRSSEVCEADGLIGENLEAGVTNDAGETSSGDAASPQSSVGDAALADASATTESPTSVDSGGR